MDVLMTSKLLTGNCKVAKEYNISLMIKVK
jgi:hypothetical protein